MIQRIVVPKLGEVTVAEISRREIVEHVRAGVDEAVNALVRAGEVPPAGGLDVCILDTGSTAVVELNDGLGLGAYELLASPCCDFLLTRWAQLTEEVTRQGPPYEEPQCPL